MSDKAEIKQPDTPELEKQRKVIDSGHNQTIADFLDWLTELIGVLRAHDTYVEEVDFERLWNYMPNELHEKKLTVLRKFWRWMRKNHSDMRIFDIRIQDTLEKYFDIDPNAIENERRELIAGLRAGHELTESRKGLGLTD
jgi:hypothetical protein